MGRRIATAAAGRWWRGGDRELNEEVAREFAIHGVLEGQHNMMTPVGKEVGTRMPTPYGDMTGRLYHVPVEQP